MAKNGRGYAIVLAGRPNKRINPTTTSRRITGGALRKLMNQREASGQAAARVMRGR